MVLHDKLALLADASRFDLSCTCGSRQNDDHRRRGKDGLWLYPVSLPRGGSSVMLKTLMSSSCVNDCRSCPLRITVDSRRCTLGPHELARGFMDYVPRGRVFGLFLSSGVVKDLDHTMDRITGVARVFCSRYSYRGYIHLKIIPGASDGAIEEAVRLANAVSLNVEVPTGESFKLLSTMKDFRRDIVGPLKRISALTAPGTSYGRVKQSTQFNVGTSRERDAEIIRASFDLYRNQGLSRIYFSAYQRGLGDPDLPGEGPSPNLQEGFLREHRPYQADLLIRRYHWNEQDFFFNGHGNLPLEIDPKRHWAARNPELFPVRLRSADRQELLRVPGLGLTTVERIVRTRRETVLRNLRDVGLRGKRLQTARAYTCLD